MKSVSYFYNKELGNFYYGQNHPMKPHRIRMTNELITNYNLLPLMTQMCPKDYPDIIESIDFTKFHSDEYIDFLSRVTPDNMKFMSEQLLYFNLGEDCPVFDGLYDFCNLYTSGSILGAHYLKENISDIAINWSGGLHHAKKHESSGFCYVNDCVLAILELLTKYDRVLYVDIDIHHGDGVEEAFFTTDRVLTCSFHKYGEYFPGTGSINDVGFGLGKNYAVNFPLGEGMDDISFEYIFKKTIENINEKYKPNVIVMQCGADCLSGDRLGCFNLSVAGHGACLKYIKSLNLPLLILGGGGYTLRNVPRCWTYETGIILNKELADEIPRNDFIEYFYPEYKLHIPVTNMENSNSPEYLNKILEQISNNLKTIRVPCSSLDLSGGFENPSVVTYDKSLIDQEILDNNPDSRILVESKPSLKDNEFEN